MSLVVPGRNVTRTLRACLEAAEPLLDSGRLEEIVYVDDGSSDASAALAQQCGVRCLDAGGRGPGGARNVGWRAATGALIWFIDADCVVESDTLGQAPRRARR